MTSTGKGGTVIKINWNEIKSLKSHLLRTGFTEDSELTLMVFYGDKAKNDRIKVRLNKLDRLLFDAESNPNITSLYLFDGEAKRPLWRKTAEVRSNSFESVPSSGHPNIIRDFSSMSPEKRDVWIDITVASIQQYTEVNEV